MLLRDNIPVKYVFGKIKTEIVLIALYTLTIAVIYDSLHFTLISIPLSVPMILGTVISLLLGFRSSQAYDRWWEARTIWGAIVNDSRTLGRQISTMVSDNYGPAEYDDFKANWIRRQMAWCHSLTGHLRNRDGTRGLKRFLKKEELQFLSDYDNIPAAILLLHARDLRLAYEQGWINQYQQMEIDKTLTRLCDSMGACERIKNTVFPATYSLYIHIALIFFIMLLPFGLIEFFAYMEVPLVIAIAALFLLIEKMAIHLQDPFENRPTDTPMDTISNTIERDLKQVIHEEVGEKKPQGENVFYVM